MNNSSDFMMYLHQDRVQRMRQNAFVGQEPRKTGVTDEMLQSPFARVRNAISIWVASAKDHDINPS